MVRIAALAIFLATPLPVLAQSQDFGAISYSPVDDYVAVHIQHPSQKAAEKSARLECRANAATAPDSCRPMIWFHNACGAFADASNGAYGTAWGETPKVANAKAIEVCESFGGEDCSPRIYGCAPSGESHIYR